MSTNLRTSTISLGKINQQRSRILRQKEETLRTVLTSAKSNPYYVKLIIYSLNTIEGFVTPPSREIHLNAIQGVSILQEISIIHQKNNAIITQIGNILWKLITIYDNIVPDLAKLFADNNGQKAIIEILISNQKPEGSIPYFRILNKLVQIHQLVAKLLDGEFAKIIKIINDLYPNDVDVISMNFDMMKSISNQKAGRDFILVNKLIDSIINNINLCAKMKNGKAVLCGLTVCDNLSRSDQGKNAIIEANGIECLLNVLEHLDKNDEVVKICAKIYSKVSSINDLLKQIELMQKYYNVICNEGIEAVDLNKVNKCFLLIGNYIIVDKMCKVLCEKDKLKLLEDIFNEIMDISLERRKKEFISSYIIMNKYIMVMFYRIFAVRREIYDKTTEIGKEKSDLIKKIRSSISKILECVSEIISTGDYSSNEDIINAFRGYFCVYNDIIYQNYKSISSLDYLDNEFYNTLVYIINNIIINGEKYFNVDMRSNFIASRVIKTACELSKHSTDLIPSIVSCYDYITRLLSISEHNETLSNCIDVINELFIRVEDFNNSKISDIIVNICTFMKNKKQFRYPCLICMKILDRFLSPEFITIYIQSPDPSKDKTHEIDYINCIVSVITQRYYKSSIVIKENQINKNTDDYNNNNSNEYDAEIERVISNLGGKLLSRLFDMDNFISLIKQYGSQSENFVPQMANNDTIIALEETILTLYSTMNIKEYYTDEIDDIIPLTKNLIIKEVMNAESYKRDKEKMKSANFKETLESFSNRMKIELTLILKIGENARDDNDNENAALCYDILITFLSKSTDISNILIILKSFNTEVKYILDNENLLILEKNEWISEKFIITCNNLLRKLIEEEKAIYPILESMILFAEIKIELCNILVKGGCPRMLLQIMESTANAKTAEIGLSLLKILILSNAENLNMIRNQNIFLKILELRTKYAGNSNITSTCDLITNEIMKLPKNDIYSDGLLQDELRDFKGNITLDYRNQEAKEKLLYNLELINAFTSNEKKINILLNSNFTENLIMILDKTLNDNEVSQINEKLLINELEILHKVKSNEISNYELISGKIIIIIKTKSIYKDIFLGAARSFAYMLKQENIYNEYLSSKIDTQFIDCLFDISENYLDDANVSKEINNILCLLCLKNDKFAEHIKTMGGLANVIEDLKVNISINDENSQQLKFNSLKMLNSICSEDSSMLMFIKANGLELLKNIIMNELNMLIELGAIEDNIDDILFKTNEPISFIRNDEEIKESYFVYCIKMIKNGIDKGNKEFIDEKQMRNLVMIANGKYPDIFLVNEICNIYNRNDVNIPENDKDLFFLIKTLISIQARYSYEKESMKKIVKLYKKMCNKLTQSKTYTNMLKDDLSKIKLDNINDVNCCNNSITYLSLFTDISEEYSNIYGCISKEILDAYNKLIEFYLGKSKLANETICEGIIISLMKIAYFLLSKKENLNSLKTTNNFITLSLQFFKSEHMEFIVKFIEEFTKLLNILGKILSPLHYTPHYIRYLQTVYNESIELIINYNTTIKETNDYNSISEYQRKAIDLFIAEITIYYSTDDDKDKKSNLSNRIVNELLDMIENLPQCSNIDEIVLKDKLNKLWICLNKIILQIPITDEDIINRILSLMKDAKQTFSNIDDTFDSIINSISKNSENNMILFEKIFEYISNDFIEEPQKATEENFNTLANLSQHSVAVKILLKNIRLFKSLRVLYDKKDLEKSKRRNLAIIYSNVMKNSYNFDIIINTDPETFKSIVDKVSTFDNVIKEEKDMDIAEMEVETICIIMRDEDNYMQLNNKGLLTDDDIQMGVSNYKSINKELSDKLGELLKKKQEEKRLNEEMENLKVDKTIVENLKKRIEKAFDEHIKEEAKLNQERSKDNNKEQTPKEEKNLDFIRQMSLMTSDQVLQKTSTVRKRKLSTVSMHLFFSQNNATIKSSLSIKNNSDISTSLDSILALIRLLYNNNKSSGDKEIKKEREDLILEALKLCKMLSLCPDNHQAILELGLMNFMEKVAIEKENNFLIYIACLDILKNCTWSENAVLVLLTSSFLDNLIEEVIYLYSKPELILENDELKTCFLYDNINFSNICKCQKGFDIIFKKIGVDKLRQLGVNTGNVNLLFSIVDMLINYIINNSDKELSDDIINDILAICKKALTLTDVTLPLFIKSLQLLGIIFNDKIKDKMNELNIIQKINEQFDTYKDDPNFIKIILFSVDKISTNNAPISTEVINSPLLEKLIMQVMLSEIDDYLIENLSSIQRNVAVSNPENCQKICKDQIIENIIVLIEKYSTKIKPSIKSCSAVTNALTGKKENNTIMSIENRILINLITALNALAIDNKSVLYLAKTRFLTAILNTLEKSTIDVKIVSIALLCLSNYFAKEMSSLWKHSEIDQLFKIFKSLHKEYYSVSEILMSINYISKFILRGFDFRIYIEKYYTLIIDGLNAQDWNVPLAILTLQIMKETLEIHEDIRSVVFDNTKQTLYSLLRSSHHNNVEVQILVYQCFSVFANSQNLAYFIVSSDIIPIARDTINNEEFNAKVETKVEIRASLMELLEKLAYDESCSKIISRELLEQLLSELLGSYSDDFVSILRAIIAVINHRCCIESLLNYNGLEAILSALYKYNDKVLFVLECFKIISLVAADDEENKKKIISMKYIDLITSSIEKCKNNRVTFEGNILLCSLNSVSYNEIRIKKIDYNEIRTEQLLKTEKMAFLIKGEIIKVFNPKGKLKEKYLNFSHDLMKVYAKPIKSSLLPKAKYVIETAHITEVAKGHGTVKKGKGLFKSFKKVENTFSIIGNVGADGNTKVINVMCENQEQVNKWISAINILLSYMNKMLTIITQPY